MDKDIKLLKQYVIIKDIVTDEDMELYCNCYLCNKVVEKVFYFEIIRNDKVIGLIFKNVNIKLVLEKDVIYG